MGIDLPHPNAAAAFGIDRVRIRTPVAEVDRIAASTGMIAVAADGERRTDSRLGRERPVGAAGARIERMDAAVLARNENSSARDRGLAAHRGDVRKTERPLDLQMRQVGGAESSELARLKARVRNAV